MRSFSHTAPFTPAALTSLLVTTALLATALIAGGRAAQAQIVYVESNTPGVTGGARLGTLDLASGNYSLIGTHATLMTGLALSSSGVLYGSSFTTVNANVTNNFLFTLDRNSGQQTLLGSLGFTTSRLNSIAYASDGQLYGLLSASSGAASLIRITTPQAGAPTASLVGSLGFISNGGLAGDNAGSLYATQGNITPDEIGSVYQITPTPVAANLLAGDPGFFNSVFGLTFAEGALYGIDNGAFGQGGIYQIDPISGSGTQTASYNPVVAGNVSAASNVIAPEPGTLALALAGIGTLGIVRRRRRK
ncbi:MAG: PEP-CTERM sorting domain-containing protein [Cytophagales bacterium]|nr:PEP-CTERM sorting domain-containing protein [Armatimonadota bacterium]